MRSLTDGGGWLIRLFSCCRFASASPSAAFFSASALLRASASLLKRIGPGTPGKHTRRATGDAGSFELPLRAAAILLDPS